MQSRSRLRLVLPAGSTLLQQCFLRRFSSFSQRVHACLHGFCCWGVSRARVHRGDPNNLPLKYNTHPHAALAAALPAQTPLIATTTHAQLCAHMHVLSRSPHGCPPCRRHVAACAQRLCSALSASCRWRRTPGDCRQHTRQGSWLASAL